MKFSKILIPMIFVLTVASCSMEDPVQREDGHFFTVKVGSEEFVMFIRNPETIRLAKENFEGKNNLHPHGRISTGNGGVNSPWSWHYVPESVQMVAVSIELCDGLPSYVNSHLNDFLTSGYCPWTAKVIKVGR